MYLSSDAAPNQFVECHLYPHHYKEYCQLMLQTEPYCCRFLKVALWYLMQLLKDCQKSYAAHQMLLLSTFVSKL
jgi:hypothetical protein